MCCSAWRSAWPRPSESWRLRRGPAAAAAAGRAAAERVRRRRPQGRHSLCRGGRRRSRADLPGLPPATAGGRGRARGLSERAGLRRPHPAGRADRVPADAGGSGPLHYILGARPLAGAGADRRRAGDAALPAGGGRGRRLAGPQGRPARRRRPGGVRGAEPGAPGAATSISTAAISTPTARQPSPDPLSCCGTCSGRRPRGRK